MTNPESSPLVAMQGRWMFAEPLHDWPRSVAEARELQPRLAARVVVEPCEGGGLGPTAPASEQGLPRLIAGVDVSYTRFETRAYVAAVLWDRVTGEVVERHSAVHEATFPYVPGYLSFREGPVALAVLALLGTRPQAYMFDGQGIAHPRRFGLASHLGLWLGAPSVGCAKSRLLGEHDEPGPERGGAEPLWAPTTGHGAAAPGAEPERLGTVVRTKSRTKPLYISPGHLCSHEFAVRLVLACGRGYRVPEPTRLADLETKRLRREQRGIA